MKKIITVLMILSLNMMAQTEAKKDTSYWHLNGFFGLNLSQTSASNWQGGAQDNIAFAGLLNFELNYKKDKHEWVNRFDGSYGIMRLSNAKFWQKNVDQLFYMSKYSLYAFKKYWFYTVMGDFRSQFSDGYKYYDDTLQVAVSRFCSPGYIQLALGLDYKPADYFLATLSPVAGKVTLVTDQNFANAGDYGVEKAVRDSAGNIITPGKKARYEFGGRLTLKFKKDITKQFSVDTYADFFSNYSKEPQNIDIVWNTLLTLKITKFFTATLSTKFLYDHDVTIKYDWNNDGKYDHKNDIFGPRAQVLSVYGIGFGYKF